MPLNGIDHVEFYVGNAAQAAYFYEHAFGFRRVAYAGLETGAARPHVARARAGTHPAGADRHARAPTPRSRAITPATATASGRSPSRSPTSTTPTPRRSAAAPAASRSPHVVSDEHGQVRRASDRHLRRHAPHLRRPLRATTGPFLPGFEAVARSAPPRPTRCCWRSTTSSATSSSATWRSGSSSTRTSSAWSS